LPVLKLKLREEYFAFSSWGFFSCSCRHHVFRIIAIMLREVH